MLHKDYIVWDKQLHMIYKLIIRIVFRIIEFWHHLHGPYPITTGQGWENPRQPLAATLLLGLGHALKLGLVPSLHSLAQQLEACLPYIQCEIS